MGRKRNYSQFISEIILCAKSESHRHQENDVVTIALPNCPQGIIMFYAVNMMGAVKHDSPAIERRRNRFLSQGLKSVCAITLDQFYDKFAAVRGKVKLKKLIITSIKDALNTAMKIDMRLHRAERFRSFLRTRTFTTGKTFR